MGMLPSAYEESFSCLLDGVPAKDFAIVRKIIEEELGGKLEDHFESFDSEPIAAASIGQVHRARLRQNYTSSSSTVTDVVVKVQEWDLNLIVLFFGIKPFKQSLYLYCILH